ncbi:MAG: polyribonucleotide nucleotidyltransferase, partial [Arsenophonus sp. ER-QC15-MAG3]
WNWQPEQVNEKLYNRIYELTEKQFICSYHFTKKQESYTNFDAIRENTTYTLLQENEYLDITKINEILIKIRKRVIRTLLLQGELRIDGREKDMIRPLDIRIGVLPRTHGSALFTRGETQALVTVTLGIERDGQLIDDIMGEYTDYFLFHYNFPPYAVGETGIISSLKRREIGHGRLAKRGILAVMPNQSEFPYTLR